MKTPNHNVHRLSRPYYNYREMTSILKTASTHGPFDELRVRLQAQAAFRSKEVETLYPDTFDLKNRRICVPSFKKLFCFRTIPMQEGLFRCLEEMTAKGLLIKETAIRSPHWAIRLARIIHKAGIQIIPHGLRHGYAANRFTQIGLVAPLALEMGINAAYAKNWHDGLLMSRVSEKDAADWFAA